MAKPNPLNESAIHEAGHVVVIAELGLQPIEAWVNEKDRGGRVIWNEPLLPPVTPAERLRIALAGQVAVNQAKGSPWLGFEYGEPDSRDVDRSLKEMARTKKAEAVALAEAIAGVEKILAERASAHSLLARHLNEDRHLEFRGFGWGEQFFRLIKEEYADAED
jgi:hypothetical protein